MGAMAPMVTTRGIPERPSHPPGGQNRTKTTGWVGADLMDAGEVSERLGAGLVPWET